MRRNAYEEIQARADIHLSELYLKDGIADGSIKLSGNEISGNTYKAKEAIKDYFKATWNSQKKCWIVPDSEIEGAKSAFKNGIEI